MKLRLVVVGAGMVAAGAVAAVALAACILADAPPDQPHPPTRRPAIVHAAVTPPASRPFGDPIPDEFVVPVQLSDPRVPFKWRLFIDYDPNTNPEGALAQTGTGAGTPTSADLQTVTFSVDREALQGSCHTIEFVVALDFESTHGADPAGADSVTWFYVPQGNLAGCSNYDAGPDGALPVTPSDAAADGGAD